MDGFTVSNANRFLETGRLPGDQQSIPINSSQSDTSSKLGTTVGGADATQKSFADTLSDAIQSVNSMQQASDKAIQNLATGRTDNIAEVMVAADKADIALKLMVQVRNKIIDAYQDIMKMQV
ncbi:MAG: flagellar hook-basal body complex protein FliE [Bdellovibrio sp. CG10_big_fil_rev_8_21_14_0_10_47_8]|nr:MAG: flagellar hook-basal body complex protein FliE [Bdellovibrio sp. CG10_big_fil_rev_8_21_14_0_10_47_8]